MTSQTKDKRKYRRKWVRGYYRRIKIKTYVKIGNKKYLGTKFVHKWIKPYWRKIKIE